MPRVLNLSGTMKIRNSWDFFLGIIARDNFNYLKKKGGREKMMEEMYNFGIFRLPTYELGLRIPNTTA